MTIAIALYIYPDSLPTEPIKPEQLALFRARTREISTVIISMTLFAQPSFG